MKDNEYTRPLQALGFTEIEALIYGYLVENSPATGYRISHAIGKQPPNTYKAIVTLENKGAIIVEVGGLYDYVIPLMADESTWDHNDVVSIFEKKAADIINIKIAKSCGLLGAKKIEHVSDATGMTCLIGTEIEPGMSIAAKIHLAASIRNLVYACEFTELSLINESLLQPKIEIEDGYITVPDGDGFGFDIDEDLLEKYRMKL